MNMEQVGVNELKRKMKEDSVAPLRVGATIDPNRRAREYAKKYTKNATMYYAETSKMKSIENQLLTTCSRRGGCWLNVQKSSNVPDDKGYVYAIFP